jgi:hypothetical protein
MLESYGRVSAPLTLGVKRAHARMLTGEDRICQVPRLGDLVTSSSFEAQAAVDGLQVGIPLPGPTLAMPPGWVQVRDRQVEVCEEAGSMPLALSRRRGCKRS